MTEQVLHIQGMHCAGCGKTVQSAIESLSGVRTASAHFRQGTVEVSYDETQLGTEDIIRAVREAGYDVLLD